MLSNIITGALLLFGAATTSTLALPQTTGTLLPLPQICTIADYGPFKLFATRTDTGKTYPVRLLSDTTSTSGDVTSTMIVSTNETCTNCGKVPSYWQLTDMVLSAVDATGPADVKTVNQDVAAHSDLTFITAKAPEEYPFYCAVKGAANEAPLLSVHGTTKLFTMCAFTSVFPPATRFTIVYDRSTLQPVGESCYPISLVAQSIGIVPT